MSVKIQAHQHPWDVSHERALTIQARLARHLKPEGKLDDAHSVAGIDVSFPRALRRGDQQWARAAVVVLTYPQLKPIEQVVAERPVEWPYIPGLLSFREGPVVLAALEKLRTEPDVLIFDGQGLAHPRRLGLATHLGILLDRPSIGCAKSRLCGQYQGPGPNKGDWAPLIDEGERIGAVVRSRDSVKPIFVSIGQHVDLETAIDFSLSCCTRYRLPEPTRLAHQAAGGKQLSLNP
jgi:deoxyribonuclease V